MREHIEVLRQLFTMEPVTYAGGFVQLDRVQLDAAFGDTSPRDTAIYIGATGPKMLELGGEICDGVGLNYVVSTAYIRDAVARIERGAVKAGKRLEEVDRPELIVCYLSDQYPDLAMAEAKKLAAYYLATEPHIMKASGADYDLLAQVQSLMSCPATEAEADYTRASKLIPDAVVHNIMAVGTADQYRAKVAEHIAAGVTCPILYPMMDDIRPVIDAFADWEP